MIIDFLELHAREILGLSSEWHAVVYKRIPREDTHFEIELGLHMPLREPLLAKVSKERPRWHKKPRKTAIFSYVEHNAWLVVWAEKNGRCPGCVNGRVGGHTCSRCGAQTLAKELDIKP